MRSMDRRVEQERRRTEWAVAWGREKCPCAAERESRGGEVVRIASQAAAGPSSDRASVARDGLRSRVRAGRGRAGRATRRGPRSRRGSALPGRRRRPRRRTRRVAVEARRRSSASARSKSIVAQPTATRSRSASTSTRRVMWFSMRSMNALSFDLLAVIRAAACRGLTPPPVRNPRRSYSQIRGRVVGEDTEIRPPVAFARRVTRRRMP